MFDFIKGAGLGILKAVVPGGGVLATVAEGLIGTFTEKQKLKQEEAKWDAQEKRSLHMLREKRMEQGHAAEVMYHKVHDPRGSWKDEYWTIILSIPAVFAFVPGAEEWIMNGFEVLDEMPAWYQAALAVAIAAAFATKKYAEHQMRKAYGLPASTNSQADLNVKEEKIL